MLLSRTFLICIAILTAQAAPLPQTEDSSDSDTTSFGDRLGYLGLGAGVGSVATYFAVTESQWTDADKKKCVHR